MIDGQKIIDILYFWKEWDWFTTGLMFFIIIVIWVLLVEFFKEAKKQGLDLSLEVKKDNDE